MLPQMDDVVFLSYLLFRGLMGYSCIPHWTLPSQWGLTLPKLTSFPREWPVASDWHVPRYKGPALFFWFETTLKDHPSFRASCKTGWGFVATTLRVSISFHPALLPALTAASPRHFSENLLYTTVILRAVSREPLDTDLCCPSSYNTHISHTISEYVFAMATALIILTKTEIGVGSKALLWQQT